MATRIVFLALTAIFINFTISAQAEQCRDLDNGEFEVESGRHSDGSRYEFEFFSYFGKESGGEKVFGRCVFNKHNKPVWIEWKKLGLTGSTTKSNDKYEVEYAGSNTNKKTDKSRLFYGARPDELNPEAIYRLEETGSISPTFELSVLRAQFTENIDLDAALSSPGLFNSEQEKFRNVFSKGSNLRTFVSARVALPINDKVFQRLRDGADDLKNEDFFAVDIFIVQRYSQGGDVIRVRPQFVIAVPESEFRIFENSSVKLEVDLSGTDDRLLEFLRISSTSLSTSQFRIIAGGKESYEFKYPLKRQEATMRMNFSNYAGVEFPVLIPVR